MGSCILAKLATTRPLKNLTLKRKRGDFENRTQGCKNLLVGEFNLEDVNNYQETTMSEPAQLNLFHTNSYSTVSSEYI